MFVSLRRRMDLLFLAFFALVIISVAASSWIIQTQNQDALVINLAGRQRMLIQQMIKDALQVEERQHEDHAHRAAMEEAAAAFDQTLSALINGGHSPYLPNRPVSVPATQSPEILAGLYQVERTWNTFSNSLNTIIQRNRIAQILLRLSGRWSAWRRSW